MLSEVAYGRWWQQDSRFYTSVYYKGHAAVPAPTTMIETALWGNTEISVFNKHLIKWSRIKNGKMGQWQLENW